MTSTAESVETVIVSPIIVVYDPIEDPRADLAEDHSIWVEIFRETGTGPTAGDRSLWRLFQRLRAYGARIHWVMNGAGVKSLKLDYALIVAHPDFAENGWTESKVKQDWLVPAGAQIAAVFRAVEGRVRENR